MRISFVAERRTIQMEQELSIGAQVARLQQLACPRFPPPRQSGGHAPERRRAGSGPLRQVSAGYQIIRRQSFSCRVSAAASAMAICSCSDSSSDTAFSGFAGSKTGVPTRLSRR